MSRIGSNLIVFLIVFPCFLKSQQCSGNIKDIHQTCIAIEGGLIIEDFDPEINGAESYIRHLSQIETIEGGLVVMNNYFEKFDLLPNVERITNTEGPAITFRKNNQLKHIRLPKLQALEVADGDYALLFDKDNYPSFVRKDTDEFKELLKLENIFNRYKARKECGDHFIRIVTEESSSLWAYLLIFGACALVALYALLIFMFFKFKKEKNEEESQKSSSLTRSVKGHIAPKRVKPT